MGDKNRRSRVREDVGGLTRCHKLEIDDEHIRLVSCKSVHNGSLVLRPQRTWGSETLRAGKQHLQRKHGGGLGSSRAPLGAAAHYNLNQMSGLRIYRHPVQMKYFWTFTP